MTVILHAGRPLKQSDIEVVFSDDEVHVGLTGKALLLILPLLLVYPTLTRTV